MENSKEFYTVKEASNILNINIRLIQSKVKKGEFPQKKWCPCGKAWLLHIEDIEKMKNERKS